VAIISACLPMLRPLWMLSNQRLRRQGEYSRTSDARLAHRPHPWRMSSEPVVKYHGDGRNFTRLDETLPSVSREEGWAPRHEKRLSNGASVFVQGNVGDLLPGMELAHIPDDRILVQKQVSMVESRAA